MTCKEFIQVTLISLKARVNALDGMPGSSRDENWARDRMATQAQVAALSQELCQMAIEAAKDKRIRMRRENRELLSMGEVPDCEFQYAGGGESRLMCRKEGAPLYGEPCDGKVCQEDENEFRTPTMEEIIADASRHGFFPDCAFRIGLDSGHGVICNNPSSPHYKSFCDKNCDHPNGGRK